MVLDLSVATVSGSKVLAEVKGRDDLVKALLGWVIW